MESYREISVTQAIKMLKQDKRARAVIYIAENGIFVKETAEQAKGYFKEQKNIYNQYVPEVTD